MNQFINPIFLIRLLKSYIFDINRIWHIDLKKLKKFQDKELRKAVKYAYTVPVYNKKYKEFGVHPNDIKTTEDIKKLPFITKDDLRANYPKGIIPKGFDEKHGFLISTSGSTGKPVFVYYDLFSAIKYLEGFVRILKAYGGNWRKSKIVCVMDLEPGTPENTAFTKSISPFLEKFISTKNIKYLHVGEDSKKLINEINEFKPDYLGTDPSMLREIAYLKNNGFGKDINPRYLFSSGAMLDKYTRLYVEKAFETKVLDTYGSAEGGPLAFECVQGDCYHVNSDFVYLEFLDEKNNPVPYGKPGRLIVTKLYGKGTPIIRYTGVEDIVIPIEKKTSCGITTEMIKHIEGRSMEMIILPNKKTLAPFNVTSIPALVMDDFKTYKIKQFQIIQHKIDEIEVLVIIDKRLKNIGPSDEELLKELKNRFLQVIGNDVKISIKEVDIIEKDVRSDHIKVVVSKIKKNHI